MYYNHKFYAVNIHIANSNYYMYDTFCNLQ